MNEKQNRIYVILGDVKRGAITIELGVYNVQDIINLAVAGREKEILNSITDIFIESDQREDRVQLSDIEEVITKNNIEGK